jgi:hypothetical protein
LYNYVDRDSMILPHLHLRLGLTREDERAPVRETRVCACT